MGRRGPETRSPTTKNHTSTGSRRPGQNRQEIQWEAHAHNGTGSLDSIDQRTTEIRRRKRPIDDPSIGLTLPVYDDKRDLQIGEPVLKNGLEISMFEPDSRAFIELLNTSYGLDSNTFPDLEITRQAIKRNGEREQFEEAQKGTVEEIILFRRAERQEVSRKYPESELNTNFLNFLQETYGLSSKKETEKFYHENMDNASRFYRWYISKVVPQSKNYLSQRNEIDPPPANPARLVHLLVSRNSSDEMKDDVQKLINSFFLSCEFTSRQWESRLREKLNNLMVVLDEQFFAGQTGEAHNVSLLAWHNAKTGRVINMQDPDKSVGPIPQDGVIKEHKLKMRKMLEDGEDDTRIWIDLDEKGILSAMAKSLHKARRKQANEETGSIHPIKDAVDLCRLVMVVNGNTQQRDKVLRRFVDIIENPDCKEIIGETEWIKSDDSTNKKGKAKKFKNRRIQIKFADIPIPVEIQFYDAQNYLNSQLAIGKKIGNTYNGEAHDLYELEKLGELIPVLLPEDVYGDLEPEFQTTKDRVASDILGRTLEVRAA